jgi:hypothetical protein
VIILASDINDYLDNHQVLLAVFFAAGAVLNDWQDARKGGTWWLHLGFILLISAIVGAIVNKLWSAFIICLIAVCVDVLLLRRLCAPLQDSPRS